MRRVFISLGAFAACLLLVLPVQGSYEEEPREGEEMNDVILHLWGNYIYPREDRFPDYYYAVTGGPLVTSTVTNSNNEEQFQCPRLGEHSIPDNDYYENVGGWFTEEAMNDFVISGILRFELWAYAEWNSGFYSGGGYDVGFNIIITIGEGPGGGDRRIAELKTGTESIVEPGADMHLFNVSAQIDREVVKKGDRIGVSLNYHGYGEGVYIVWNSTDHDSRLTIPCNSVRIDSEFKIYKDANNCTITATIIDCFGLLDIVNCSLTITREDEIFYHEEIRLEDWANTTLNITDNATVIWVWEYGNKLEGYAYTAHIIVRDNCSNDWRSELEFYVSSGYIAGLPPHIAVLLALLALGGGASGVLVYRRMKYGYVVKEVFLLHATSALLVSHVSSEKEVEGDEDIVGSMLMAIQTYVEDSLHGDYNPEEALQEALAKSIKVMKGDTLKKEKLDEIFSVTGDFMKESFSGEEEGLQMLRYGENLILVEKGEYVYLAVVIKGYENENLRKKITKKLAEIEDKYGDVLDSWDGDTTKVLHLANMLRPLMKVGLFGG